MSLFAMMLTVPIAITAKVITHSIINRAVLIERCTVFVDSN